MDNVRCVKAQRPDVLSSRTIKVQTGCGNLYVTVSENDDVPFEVFITLGKSGGCKQAMQEAVGRLLSWGLRSGASLEEAAEQLSGLSCPMPFANKNKSCIDAVGKQLLAHCTPKEEEKKE